jgi:RsiW-degrading membrane proteinase PrsW (M82 family)
MNTPRNVSIVEVIKLFVVAGGISVVIITLWYLIPIFGNMPGVVEETSKLAAVVLVTYGARGARYPYQLNGIIFGATVGAAYAVSETLGYAIDVFGPGLIDFVKTGAYDAIFANLPAGTGVSDGVILMPVMKATIANLNLRGLESPFGHVVWTAITAGAFWRVKGDRTANLSMVMDGRFLKAFCIPVLMHTTWDIGILFPNINPYLTTFGFPILTGVISWYVLFGMIQQGLHQVRDMQKAQLEHTLVHVEQTLGLGATVPVVVQQQPAGV